MLREIIKSICSVLLVLFFVIIIDVIIGIVGDKTFKNLPDNQSEYSCVNYAISKTKADCIILGSSHARHHYNPEVFSDTLQMSVYNAGRGGHGITYSLALFRALLSRYTPKVVILDIKYEESEEWFSRVRDLKPYFEEYPSAFETDVKVNGRREKFRLKWNSYKYNSTIMSLLISYISGSGDIDNNMKLNGYTPIPNRGNKNNVVKEQVDSVKVAPPLYRECLSELSSICEDKGIILITVSSPTLVKFKYQSPAIPIIDSLGLTYLDHFNDEYFLSHTELFRDGDHLYENGADLFSSKVSSEIKSIINKKR